MRFILLLNINNMVVFHNKKTWTRVNMAFHRSADAPGEFCVRCRNMKKLILITFVLAAAYFVVTESGLVSTQRTGVVDTISGGDQILTSAFANHRSNVQVQGGGTVTKVLADDNDGSRHQRFIIQLGSGQTLLIAHNIDLSIRIDSLKVGDRVAFNGEYEWNPQGGVIHWTHHDPAGRHPSGWIKHNGRTYQ